MKTLLLLATSRLLLAGLLAQAAGTQIDFPRVSPDGRYLVNRAGYPLMLHADSPWSLMVALTREETLTYVTNREQKGFNALVTQLIENRFGGADNPYGSPTNRYGQAPFLVPNDFSTPNEGYFTNVDWVVQTAADHGMVLLLNPCYLGIPGSGTPEGWYDVVLANGVEKCREFGRWVGNRYQGAPNIIWVMYGDRTVNSTVAPMINAMVAGIMEYDTNHIFTAHLQRGYSSRDLLEGQNWLSLNSTYTGPITSPSCLAAYALSPVAPVFLIEDYYEGEHDMTLPQLRSQSYSALLSGACGDSFGNRPIWLFDTGWQAALDSDGAASMGHVNDLFLSRQWFKLVPDANHDFVVAGYGVLGTSGYVSAAVASDGSTAMAYLPTGHTIKVDLSMLSGTNANLWWFNPRDGTASLIESAPTANADFFTPPDTNDWVLVVDAASANLPPPGSQKLRLPPSVDTGPNRLIPWPQNQVTLNPTVTFDGPPPDPAAVTYQWTVESGPAAVTFSPTNTVEAVTARFNAAGVYHLRLQVEDSGQASQGEVTVTLLTNSAPAAPGGLLCQGAVNPVAVTTTSPFLSWTFFDPDAGDAQSACRLELLDSANRLFWDSGKVSSTNAGILYSGPPLVPGHSYTWKVMVWDRFDVPGSFSEPAAFLLANASGELLTNGGFETGDATGWINLGGGQMNVGFNPPNGNKAAHSGIYQAYWDDSSDVYGAYQQVDVSAYSAAIDAGVARLEAAGWLVSNDYQASPPYDQFYLRIQFFDANGRELTPARYDTGVMNVPEWAAYGLQNFTLPPSTRNIRVEFNCWENGYDAGSADDFSLQLFLPTTLTFLTASLPGGVMGNPYSVQLEAEGGLAPLGWELAAGSDPLPAGLTLSAAGELSGVPTVSGTFSLSFRVTDAQGHSAYRTLPLTVAVQPVTITTSALVPARGGVAYSAALNAGGGSPPYFWTLSAGSAPLPAGITLGTNGVLQGTAATTGSFPFTPQVFDGLGTTAVRDLILQVDPAELRLETFPQTPAQIRAAGFQFWLYSEAPGLFAVERSFNLADWSELLTTDYDGGLLLLSDTNVNGSNHWFYRGRRQ